MRKEIKEVLSDLLNIKLFLFTGLRFNSAYKCSCGNIDHLSFIELVTKGHVCRSCNKNREYYIGIVKKHLEDMKINFINNYEELKIESDLDGFRKFMIDFYIPDKNIFIDIIDKRILKYNNINYEVKNLIIDIKKEISDFCIKNNIKYYQIIVDCENDYSAECIADLRRCIINV